MRHFVSAVVVALLSAAVASHAAHGLLMGEQLMLSDGVVLGDSITIDSTGAFSITGTVGVTSISVTPAGVISFNGSLGAGLWVLNVTTGSSKPLSGSATAPKMDLNSVNISSAAGTLTIKFTDTNFGPLDGTIANGIGGTTEGTVTAMQLHDAANGEFTGGTIANLGPFGPGAFSGSTTSSLVNDAGPFSLTEVVTINHTGAGTTSFDYSTSVPEPSILLLLGSGLAGFGYLRMRRRSRD